MSAVVWGVSDKTGKVEDDQNDDGVQNDPDMVITHLNKLSVLIQKF